jgi:hypothetical protein
LKTILNIPEAKRSKTESEQMKYSEFVKRWFHDSTKFPNLAYMAQKSKCGSQPDLICVVSSTFQSACKYIDVTYTPILQPLNLIYGAGGAERHSEVKKSQNLSLLTEASSVSPAPTTRLD